MTKKGLAIILLLGTVNFVFAQSKPKVKSAPATSPMVKKSVVRGALIYQQHCLVCHQIDGGGVPNMNPPLINTSWVVGEKKRLIKVLLNGFATNVDIDGQSYSNNMPPQTMLKDQEIADVLTYVRNNFSNKASAIKTTDVTMVRNGKNKP